jgi:CelD/BcsL family acetyltransferase involved in cellulose biosynthesis
LQEHRSEWDALFVDKLPEKSSTQTALRSAGLRSDRLIRWSSPRIELPDQFDEYLATLSQKRRGAVRRSLRAVDSGEMTVRIVSNPDALRQTIERWQQMRVEWWEGRGRPINPEHRSPRFLAFTQDVLASMVPAGLATVWEVRHLDDVVTIAIHFLDNTTSYYWLAAFNARHQGMRPGQTLIAYGIRWSIETGRRYFDFMIGDEAYKYECGPIDSAVVSMTVGNNRARSRLALSPSHLRHSVLDISRQRQTPVIGRNF